MIIDFHTHAFTDELAPRALEILSERSGIQPYTNGTCSGLLESMDRAGIDASVIAPIATKPSQVRNINKWAVQVSAEYEGRLICFGTLHPEQKDWRDEIHRLLEDGIVGIKLHPDYQGFYVDDPQMFPMYQEIAYAKLVLLLHSGVDIGLPPPVHCTPDRLARVLSSFPELTIVAAHMGGYKYWDEVERHLVGRNVYFDTSYSLDYLGAERMVSLIRAHGVDRILFATDSPWASQTKEVNGIRGLPLTEAETAAILGGNALHLLGNKYKV
jgi:predicted TIM-barrel fold metal-dependent hydrolase